MAEESNAFFDIRVMHVNFSSQAQKSTQKIFKSHEDSKKREYLERVLNVEHGFFTPLVFGTNGGMGKECQMFMKHLATLLAEKSDERYSDTVTWMRTRTSGGRTRATLDLESAYKSGLLVRTKSSSTRR